MYLIWKNNMRADSSVESIRRVNQHFLFLWQVWEQKQVSSPSCTTNLEDYLIQWALVRYVTLSPHRHLPLGACTLPGGVASQTRSCFLELNSYTIVGEYYWAWEGCCRHRLSFGFAPYRYFLSPQTTQLFQSCDHPEIFRSFIISTLASLKLMFYRLAKLTLFEAPGASENDECKTKIKAIKRMARRQQNLTDTNHMVALPNMSQYYYHRIKSPTTVKRLNVQVVQVKLEVLSAWLELLHSWNILIKCELIYDHRGSKKSRAAWIDFTVSYEFPNTSVTGLLSGSHGRSAYGVMKPTPYKCTIPNMQYAIMQYAKTYIAKAKIYVSQGLVIWLNSRRNIPLSNFWSVWDQTSRHIINGL